MTSGKNMNSNKPLERTKNHAPLSFQYVKMKLFDTPETAKGYATDRPFFHPVVISNVKSYLNLTKKVKIALDVGCGAGLSTLALLEIADKAVGVDSSESMINSAIQKKGIEYRI